MAKKYKIIEEFDNKTDEIDIDNDFENGILYLNGSIYTKYNIDMAKYYLEKAFNKDNYEAGFFLLLIAYDINDSKYAKTIFDKMSQLLKKSNKNYELAKLYRNYDYYGFVGSKEWIKYFEKAYNASDPVYNSLRWHGHLGFEIDNYYTMMYNNLLMYLNLDKEDAYMVFFDYFARGSNKVLGNNIDENRKMILDRINKAKELFSYKSWPYLLLYEYLCGELKYFEAKINISIGNEKEPGIKDKNYENDLINLAKNDLEKAIEIDDNSDAHYCLHRLYLWCYLYNYDLNIGKFVDYDIKSYNDKSNDHIYKCILNYGTNHFEYFINGGFIDDLKDEEKEELINRYQIVSNNYKDGFIYNDYLKQLKEIMEE